MYAGLSGRELRQWAVTQQIPAPLAVIVSVRRRMSSTAMEASWASHPTRCVPSGLTASADCTEVVVGQVDPLDCPREQIHVWRDVARGADPSSANRTMIMSPCALRLLHHVAHRSRT